MLFWFVLMCMFGGIDLLATVIHKDTEGELSDLAEVCVIGISLISEVVWKFAAIVCVVKFVLYMEL